MIGKAMEKVKWKSPSGKWNIEERTYKLDDGKRVNERESVCEKENGPEWDQG